MTDNKKPADNQDEFPQDGCLVDDEALEAWGRRLRQKKETKVTDDARTSDVRK
jgi:hypothetical protein